MRRDQQRHRRPRALEMRVRVSQNELRGKRAEANQHRVWTKPQRPAQPIPSAREKQRRMGVKGALQRKGIVSPAIPLYSQRMHIYPGIHRRQGRNIALQDCILHAKCTLMMMQHNTLLAAIRADLEAESKSSFDK